MIPLPRMVPKLAVHSHMLSLLTSNLGAPLLMGPLLVGAGAAGDTSPCPWLMGTATAGETEVKCKCHSQNFQQLLGTSNPGTSN